MSEQVDAAGRDDGIRKARPTTSDLEARRARAAIEGRLFEAAATRVTLGRYQVLERIGSGGMGMVYRAHDPQLDRDIAVKLMHADAVGLRQVGPARARLLREARAMARLAHPNVIHVYDVGEVEDGVFIAMELITGSSLRSWLDESPRPWQDIVGRFVEAGRGLDAAHRAGIIHRDFKPENVLIGEDGRVRVGDFGLAGATEGTPTDEPTAPSADRRLSSRSGVHQTLTRTGTLLGTPKYMAPEQDGGGEVTALSDQFSFCIALYEALYGAPPFEGDSIGEYRGNVHAQRLVTPIVSRDVPSFVYPILLRGLAHDPTHRYPSLADLIERLHAGDSAQNPRKGRQVGAVVAGFVLAGIVGLGIVRSQARAPSSASMAFAEQLTVPEVPEEFVNATSARPSARATATERVLGVEADALEPDETSAAAEDVLPSSVADLPPPIAKPRGEACYFLQDRFTPLGSTRDRQRMLQRDQACYVCRPARRTDNLAAPPGVQCRAFQICAESPAVTDANGIVRCVG